MRKNQPKFNFVGRPDRACSTDLLRPAMCQIYIDNGIMVATNAHILVKIPLHYSSIQGDLSLINDHYIDPRQYREMLTYNMLFVENTGEIKAKRSGTEYATIFKLAHRDTIGRFPNYEAVISYTDENKGYVGLNSGRLKQLISCFEGVEGVGTLVFKIQNPSKSIHVHYEGSHDVFGLIMPVILNEDWKKISANLKEEKEVTNE